MPFLEDDPGSQLMRQPIGAPPPEPPTPATWGETMGEAWRSSPAYSVASALMPQPDYQPQPGYDPIPALVGTKYEPFMGRFLGDVNPQQTRDEQAKVDQELADQDTYDRSGLAGKALTFAAGFLDPALALMPEARVAEAGIGLGTRALRATGAGLAYSAANEAEAALSHPTTPGEAAERIASNTVLMGVLGTALGHLTAPEAERAVKGLDATRADLAPGAKPPPFETPVPHAELDKSINAAEADQRTMNLSSMHLPDAVEYGLTRFSPTARVGASGSLEGKRAMFDLAETMLRFDHNEIGVPNARGGVPIDRLVKTQDNALMAQTHDILSSSFRDYSKTAEGPDKLDYAGFNREVAKAAHYEDQHPIGQVAQAASELRAKVIEPVSNLAQATKDRDGNPMLGEMLEPPRGALSFFPWQWAKAAIDAKFNEARQTFTDWYESEQLRKQAIRDKLTRLRGARDALPEEDTEGQRSVQQAIEEQIKTWGGKTVNEALAALKRRAVKEEGREEGKPSLHEADRAVDAAVDKILSSDRLDLTRQELQNRAEQTINRISNGPDGRLVYDEASAKPMIGPPGRGNEVRGSLKGRDFAIPRNLVWQFGDVHAERNIAAFLRTALPDIHLTDRFGDVTMEDEFRKIDDGFAARHKPGESEKASKALEREHDMVIRDVAAQRDRIRHIYGWSRTAPHPQAARIAQALRGVNFLADLGSSVVNRMNDMTNAVARHGMLNVFHDEFMPLMGYLTRLNPEPWKAARGSAHDMAIGLDGMLGHIQHQYEANDYLPRNRFERGLATAVDRAMWLNFHAGWTDSMKVGAASVAQSNLLRIAGRSAGGNASQKEITQLAQAGIDAPMAERIWNAFHEEGGGQVFGKDTRIANAGAWSDKAAARVFSSAVARDAEAAVLTPGGEKALFLSDPILSLLQAYKSFVAAAHEKLLLANLQQMDTRTLQYLVTAIGTGMLSTEVYSLISGTPTPDTPQGWIKEAVDRSAMLGWLGSGIKDIGKATGGALDPWRLVGAGQPYMRRSEDTAGSVLGPTWEKLTGIAQVATDSAQGKWTGQDTHKLRMLLPLQNWWAIRGGLDAVENGFNNAIGVKPRARALQYH